MADRDDGGGLGVNDSVGSAKGDPQTAPKAELSSTWNFRFLGLGEGAFEDGNTRLMF